MNNNILLEMRWIASDWMDAMEAGELDGLLVEERGSAAANRGTHW